MGFRSSGGSPKREESKANTWPVASRRGQSSIIGVVLIFGLTVVTVTAILVAGSTALSASQDDATNNRAELALTQFDSQAALVALGDSTRQRTTIELGGRGASLAIDESAGWMNVSVQNATPPHTIEDTIMNVTMGAVRYQKDGVTIAYQGGGVWRTQSGGSVMVSPPEFHYRTTGGQEPTVTLPLVVVHGSGSPGEDVMIEKRNTIPKYPQDGNPDRSNPLEEGEIVITVHSEYYLGWGSFFDERTGAAVTYDHANEIVTITLSIPSGFAPGVPGGIVDGASGGTVTFQNHAGADSYNSSAGPYSVSNGDNTTIVAAGDVELQNNGDLYGDLEAGGSVELENQATIHGNLSYGATLSMDGGATVMGSIDNQAEVPTLDPVDAWIDEKRSSYEDPNNDNSVNPDVDESTNTLNACQPTPCELDATGGDGEGQYYLSEIHLQTDDELVLNTTNGPVNIVVTGDVTFEGDANVSVTGSNRANFYLEKTLTVQNQANVSVPGDKSPRLWFFMNPGQSADFKNNIDFVGVVYGPGSGAQSGVDIGLNNQANIKGGLVGRVPSVNNNIGLHYDEALVGIDPFGGEGFGKPPVTYIHITVNEINVSSG